MKRKKWTPHVEITESVLKIREKKKWQLALRRYLIEKNPSIQYAPYFGLPIDLYRQWIELQFTDALSWDNFGTAWHFDHVVPVTYFDYTMEDDLKLCWSFVNIRVEPESDTVTDVKKIDVIAAKSYFESLYKATSYETCLKMIRKIEQIEASGMRSEPKIEHFIVSNSALLNTISEMTPDELNRVNAGTSLKDVLFERELLKKFGS